MNPYASPESLTPIEPSSLSALGELVKSWEKLRLFYNGILLLPGIGVMALAVSNQPLTIASAIFFACVMGASANAAFFLGPLAELYLRALFFKSRPVPLVRKLLLGGGLLVSFGAMGIALLGIFS